MFEGRRLETIRDPHTGKLKIAGAELVNNTRSVDVSWLPLAAETYCISPNINDYIITEIPIVTVDVPNRNLDAFPFSEVTSFNNELGRLTYATFIGKPTFRDHDNRDPRKARGVHFDSHLERLASGLYKIVVLAGWDRTKDYELVNGILNGPRNAYSMGALVGFTTCSYPGCGETSTNGRIGCIHHQHGRGKGRVINGYIIYENCNKVNYIETSSLGSDPADYTAIGRWVKPWKE
jgi:hypothetical protein